MAVIPQVKDSPAALAVSRQGGTEPVGQQVALLVSVLVHVLGLIILAMSAFMSPKRPSEVPIFELVALEKPPKLRPIKPKVLPPPEPPPPEPEQVRAPDPPKLTPKPTNAVQPKPKKEPRVVKEDPDTTLPVKEVVERPDENQPAITVNAPSDPRLGLWAGRVKKKAETLWNPPTGIDIIGSVKTVISFKVSRDGTVSDAAVATGTGNSDLDELALRTIQRMEHVPPIPENFPDDMIQVSCEFPYNGQ